GMYLADNYSSLLGWPFPGGATINPGEFKVVFADGQPTQSTATEWHTNFRLGSASGSVALSRSITGQAQVLDYLNFQGVSSGRSYGSYPDGQPLDRQEFFYLTPGRPNNPASAPLTVFINEWMAGNTKTLTDPADGHFDDWFELYNPTMN